MSAKVCDQHYVQREDCADEETERLMFGDQPPEIKVRCAWGGGTLEGYGVDNEQAYRSLCAVTIEHLTHEIKRIRAKRFGRKNNKWRNG